MTFLEAFIDNLLTSRRLPYPNSAYIEPVSNICQLKCPLCPVGAQLLPQDHKYMSLETFKTLLDKMQFLKSIELYRSGEPFLNPELLEMVRYAHHRNISVVISTNFSFSRTDSFFEEIVASGLRTLVVSLDGASQESYARYRIGGNYDQVMDNIKKLIATKNRLHSKTPKIIWQFLVNRYNEHEIPVARDMAAMLGVALDFRPISLADNEPDLQHEPFLIEERKDQWLPRNDAYISDCYKGEYKYPLSKEICAQLFSLVIVTASGKVLPCCEVWNEDNAFGDLLTQSFEDVWYSQRYLDSRSRALHKVDEPQIQSICFKCNNFSVTSSLKDKFNLLFLIFRKSLFRWLKSCR